MNPDHEQTENRMALAALAWLVPAPSLGILAAALLPGPVGQAVFGFSKIWLLAMPVVWRFVVMQRPVVRPRLSTAGLGMGALLGFLMGAIIVGAYVAVGSRWIDQGMLADRLSGLGLDSPRVFLAGAVYWCLVNALLEEYVWRWFVFRQCHTLMSGRAAVMFSALLFTVHHVVALAVMGDTRLLLLGSAGVFLGGLIWSGCYLKYESVWPGYVSHILADVAIMAIGWRILFG